MHIKYVIVIGAIIGFLLMGSVGLLDKAYPVGRKAQFTVHFPGGNTMSIQVLTLEQVCKEHAGSRTMLESSYQQGESFIEATHETAAASKLNLSDMLRHLVKVLARPLSLDDTLSSLATVAKQAMNMDLCVILLMDQSRGNLTVHACSPDLNDQRVVIEPVEVDMVVWEHLRDAMTMGQLPMLTARERDSLSPLKNVQYETLLPLPLIVGTEYVGLMSCYSSKVQSWTDEEQLMLVTIANQAALAIKHLQHVEADILTQKNLVRSLFDDLFSSKGGMEESLYRRSSFFGRGLSPLPLVGWMERSQGGAARGGGRVMSEKKRGALYRKITQQVGQRFQLKEPGSPVG